MFYWDESYSSLKKHYLIYGLLSLVEEERHSYSHFSLYDLCRQKSEEQQTLCYKNIFVTSFRINITDREQEIHADIWWEIKNCFHHQHITIFLYLFGKKLFQHTTTFFFLLFCHFFFFWYMQWVWSVCVICTLYVHASKKSNFCTNFIYHPKIPPTKP